MIDILSGLGINTNLNGGSVQNLKQCHLNCLLEHYRRHKIEKLYEVIKGLVKEKEGNESNGRLKNGKLKGVIAELVTKKESMFNRMTNLEVIFQNIV
ncbi:hypothetical protein QVD17_05430 [Tagetes erecta]|nr:hypothetical protein QVD17_05430 [Tagetes erecta]